MTERHLELGLSGEETAAAFLRGKGLKIVDRRVRFRRGELDLVARDGAEWVFVEVKTRSSNRMGTASEAVGARKEFRLARAVKEYIHLHRLENAPIRCDVVAIDLDENGKPEISHYPAAFMWR